MQKACAEVTCGNLFEPKRPHGKYCSPTCAKRAQRRPRAAETAEQDAAAKAAVAAVLGPAGSEQDTDTPGGLDGPLTAATRHELTQARRLETALGQAALFAAIRLDSVGMLDTGAGVAAMLKTHREALEAALKDAQAEDDPLDKIRGSAALKLVQGGLR